MQLGRHRPRRSARPSPSAATARGKVGVLVEHDRRRDVADRRADDHLQPGDVVDRQRQQPLPGPPSRRRVAVAEARSAARESSTSLGWPVVPEVRTISGAVVGVEPGSQRARSTSRGRPPTGRRLADAFGTRPPYGWRRSARLSPPWLLHLNGSKGRVRARSPPPSHPSSPAPASRSTPSPRSGGRPASPSSSRSPSRSASTTPTTTPTASAAPTTTASARCAWSAPGLRARRQVKPAAFACFGSRRRRRAGAGRDDRLVAAGGRRGGAWWPPGSTPAARRRTAIAASARSASSSSSGWSP